MIINNLINQAPRLATNQLNQAQELLSTRFSGTSFVNRNVNNVFRPCGVPAGLFNTISNRYGIHIYNSVKTIDIKAWMQDKFSFKVTSDWVNLEDAITNMPGIRQITAAIRLGTQITGRALEAKALSRRFWAGSSPIHITLPLIFEATNDIDSEVIQPVLQLQQLVLPRSTFRLGDRKTELPFLLAPPGPNPWYSEAVTKAIENATDISLAGKRGLTNPGEEITLSIAGGFIIFKMVIIRSVEVDFQNRMTAKGPLGARAIIEVETYELLSREDLATSYERGEQLTSKEI